MSREVRVAGALLLAVATTGFIRIALSPEGPEFFWAEPVTRYLIQADGTPDVQDGSAAAAIRLAFASWARVGLSLGIEEDTTSDATRRDHASSDVHLVVWDEDGSSGLFPEGSGILALTPVLAATRDGRILDADIILNGRDNRFSTDLRPGTFDVQAVVTHEVGHFLGLDHANGPCSTMYHLIEAATSLSRRVGRDEAAGVASIYPLDRSRGSISGAVTKAGGQAVAYGYVVALDAATGEVAGGAPTNVAGVYALRGLPPGDYLLYVEPLDGPVAARDTVRFAEAAVDVDFATTWRPGTVSVAGGAATPGVDLAVAAEASLRPRTARAARVVAGGPRTPLVVAGSGLDAVVSASVPGPGVSVLSLSRTALGSEPAVALELQASGDAPRGARSLELRDAQGRVGLLTCGLVVLDEAPRLELVSPATLRASGRETLTLVGSGFHAPLAVLVGGVVAPEASVSADGTRVTATTPVGRRAGPLDVVAIGPDGQEARHTGAVSYLADPSASRVEPSRGPLAGGSRHTIVGSGFLGPVTVRVGGQAAAVLDVREDGVDFLLPPGSAAGAVDVAVAAGGRTVVLEHAVTYVDAPALTVTSIVPTRGPTAGGTSVALVGTGFSSAVVVRFGGVAATLAEVSATQLVVTSPPHEAGRVPVVVEDPETGFAATAPERFTYQDEPPPPTVLATRRSSGCALSVDGEGDPRAWLVALATLVALVVARIGGGAEL